MKIAVDGEIHPVRREIDNLILLRVITVPIAAKIVIVNFGVSHKIGRV